MGLLDHTPKSNNSEEYETGSPPTSMDNDIPQLESSLAQLSVTDVTDTPEEDQVCEHKYNGENKERKKTQDGSRDCYLGYLEQEKNNILKTDLKSSKEDRADQDAAKEIKPATEKVSEEPAEYAWKRGGKDEEKLRTEKLVELSDENQLQNEPAKPIKQANLKQRVKGKKILRQRGLGGGDPCLFPLTANDVIDYFNTQDQGNQPVANNHPELPHHPAPLELLPQNADNMHNQVMGGNHQPPVPVVNQPPQAASVSEETLPVNEQRYTRALRRVALTTNEDLIERDSDGNIMCMKEVCRHASDEGFNENLEALMKRSGTIKMCCDRRIKEISGEVQCSNCNRSDLIHTALSIKNNRV